MGTVLLRRLGYRWGGWVAGCLAAGLVAWSCARVVGGVDYTSKDASAYRRLWSDLTWAINDLVDARFPSHVTELPGPGVNPATAYRVVLLERTRQLDIETWQFWRRFRPWIFRAHRGPFTLGDYDDAGRAWLLSRLFRLLGGVSPYMILWVAALTALPVVAWCVHELWRCGRPVAAAFFGAALVTSPYLAESLTLPRYAVGFYLVACLLVIALGVHVALSPTLRLRSLLVRFAFAGAAFALCIACRSSSTLPLAVAVVGLGFLLVRTRRLPALGIAGLLAVLVIPTAVTRPQKHHDVWQPLWEGLGDFDRTKGHSWSDPVALGVARLNGASELWTPESERAFRHLTLEHVKDDPLWYAAILAKRTLATAFQWKLWPFGPLDGLHIRRKMSDNEGFIDKYYGYTTTADHIGFGTFAREVPVLVWPILTLLLVLHPRFARSAGDGRRAAWRGEIFVVCLVGAACLALPVLITTAGAQETQAFVLVYFLAAGFLAQRLVDAARPR